MAGCFKMKNIQVINVEDCDLSNNEIQRKLGVYISSQDDSPHIHIFEVGKGIMARAHFAFAAPYIGLQILKKYLPEKELSDVRWTYTSGAAHTDFSFKKTHGEISEVFFTNSCPLDLTMPKSIEEYQNLLSHPQTGVATNDENDIFYRGPQKNVIVPIPKHKHGFHVLRHPEQIMRDHCLVLVDPKKFMKHWLTQAFKEANVHDIDGLRKEYEAASKLMSDDDNPIAQLHSPIEKSLEYIQLRYPNEPAHISFWTRNYEPEGKTSFVNGRHRTINFYNAGAPFLPFLMYKSDTTVVFKEKFEWHGNTPDNSI